MGTPTPPTSKRVCAGSHSETYSATYCGAQSGTCSEAYCGTYSRCTLGPTLGRKPELVLEPTEATLRLVYYFSGTYSSM